MAASGEKPYRVYRGGRQKGKVPLPGREQARRQRRGAERPQRGHVRRRPQREFSRGRAFFWSLVAVIVVLIVWAVAGYLVVRGGVGEADHRLQTGSPGIDSVFKPSGALQNSMTPQTPPY